MKEFILNLLRIRRVEFRVAEIPILIMPILLERSLGAPPPSLTVLGEGFLVFFFLFAFGDMINCLADRDLDAIYKSHLSRAVYGLGVPFVWVQTIVSALAAIGIAAHLAWTLHHWMLLPLVLIGLALGAAYSVPPVRLKGRGLLQLICLWLIIFFGPMLFSAILVRHLPSISLVAFAAAYATIQMGVVLINSAEDYPEDRAAGVCNTIVALGLPAGAKLAADLAFAGGVGVLTVLSDLFLRAGDIGDWTAVLLLPLVTIGLVTNDISRLARSLAGVSEEEAIARIKRGAKRVPLWITGVAWTSCAAVAVLYWVHTS